MKKTKLLLMVLAVALFAVIFAGCTQEPVETEPPVMEAYWNLYGAQYNENGVSSREAKGGVYTIETAHKGKLVKLKVSDKALVDKIDSMQVFGVVMDEKKNVSAVKTVEDMGGKIVYEGYAFEAGDAFQLNAISPDGETVNIKTPSRSCYVTDLVKYPGEPERIYPTDLIRGDQIVAVEDYQGNITDVFFYQAGMIRSGKDQYCPHCCEEGETVHFEALMQGIAPGIEGGHYFLYEDREQSDQQGAGKNVELIIDLNGFKIFCENQTKRIFATYIKDCPEGEGCYIGIMDSSEAKTGTILNDHEQTQNGNGAGVWVTSYGTFELFSGTIDASNCHTNSNGPAVYVNSGCTFIMHEGATILGGTTEAVMKEDNSGRTGGGNGGAVYNGGTFIMYGGKIVGGTCLGYETDRGRGGAVYNGGSFMMYDGEIVGGYSDEEAYDKDGNLMDFSIYYDAKKNGFQQLGGVLTPTPEKVETPETPEGDTEVTPEGGEETPAA